MDMEIRELFIFNHYKIFVFEGRDSYYSSSKDGTVCHSMGQTGTKFVETGFQHKDTKNYKVLGKLSELTDKKCETIFKEARVNLDKYPNYNDPDDPGLDSALESIKSYLTAEGWDKKSEKTWILIPRPTKKMVGQKIPIDFKLCKKTFKLADRHEIHTLDVYMTRIKQDIKEIKYAVEIPDYIYDFLMQHPEQEKRPVSKIIESTNFATLHKDMEQRSHDAVLLNEFDDKMKSARKVLVIDFGSSQREVRDMYNFGYAGKKTNINFQFFVGYKIIEGLSSRTLFVDKKYVQGKGFIELPINQRMTPVTGQSGKIIDWTQEREDFLIHIEENFKKLSDNLNMYLSDIDEDKMNLLITQNFTKLLGGGEK